MRVAEELRFGEVVTWEDGTAYAVRQVLEVVDGTVHVRAARQGDGAEQVLAFDEGQKLEVRPYLRLVR